MERGDSMDLNSTMMLNMGDKKIVIDLDLNEFAYCGFDLNKFP